MQLRVSTKNSYSTVCWWQRCIHIRTIVAVMWRSSAAGGKDGKASSSAPAEGSACSRGQYTSKSPSQYSTNQQTQNISSINLKTKQKNIIRNKQKMCSTWRLKNIWEHFVLDVTNSLRTIVSRVNNATDLSSIFLINSVSSTRAMNVSFTDWILNRRITTKL